SPCRRLHSGSPTQSAAASATSTLTQTRNTGCWSMQGRNPTSPMPSTNCSANGAKERNRPCVSTRTNGSASDPPRSPSSPPATGPCSGEGPAHDEDGSRDRGQRADRKCGRPPNARQRWSVRSLHDRDTALPADLADVEVVLGDRNDDAALAAGLSGGADGVVDAIAFTSRRGNFALPCVRDRGLREIAHCRFLSLGCRRRHGHL